jgi:hypothetical protein
MSIKDMLNEELDKIRYHQKMEKGTLLTEEDINVIFSIFRANDQEVKPMLDIMEKLMIGQLSQDYLQVEKSILEMFKYYNILDNADFIKCRHKFFFTESKKLVKKPFFGPETLEKVKTELTIHNIFNKLK